MTDKVVDRRFLFIVLYVYNDLGALPVRTFGILPSSIDNVQRVLNLSDGLLSRRSRLCKRRWNVDRVESKQALQ